MAENVVVDGKKPNMGDKNAEHPSVAAAKAAGTYDYYKGKYPWNITSSSGSGSGSGGGGAKGNVWTSPLAIAGYAAFAVAVGVAYWYDNK